MIPLDILDISKMKRNVYKITYLLFIIYYLLESISRNIFGGAICLKHSWNKYKAHYIKVVPNPSWLFLGWEKKIVSPHFNIQNQLMVTGHTNAQRGDARD